MKFGDMRSGSPHALWLAIALALPATAGDAVDSVVGPLEEVMTMRVEGRIAVSPEGTVLAHAIDTKLEPAVRKVIDQAVVKWLFLSPMVDGKPAAVKSDMRITLVGTRVAEGYAVKIDNVVFSDPASKAAAAAEDRVRMSVIFMQPPKYPRNYHVNGLVTVQVQVAPDGTVANLSATQCSLYFAGGRAPHKQRACQSMEDNAIRAIRTWKVAIEANGRAPKHDELIAVVPIFYNIPNDDVPMEARPGEWRLESRTAYRPPAWAGRDRLQRVGTADILGNAMIPAASALQFRDRAAAGVL